MKNKAGSPTGFGRKIGQFVETLGPGLVTGASDDDPSGIATYSQVALRAVIMHMASSKMVMDKFTVPLYLRVVGWAATAVMLAVSIGVLATMR